MLNCIPVGVCDKTALSASGPPGTIVHLSSSCDQLLYVTAGYCTVFSADPNTHAYKEAFQFTHIHTHTFLQGVSTEQFMQSCCLCLSNPILPLCNIQANTRKGNIPALLASCSKDYKHYTVCKLIVINIFVKPNLCPNIEFISTTLRTFCPCKLSIV